MELWRAARSWLRSWTQKNRIAAPKAVVSASKQSQASARRRLATATLRTAAWADVSGQVSHRFGEAARAAVVRVDPMEASITSCGWTLRARSGLSPVDAGDAPETPQKPFMCLELLNRITHLLIVQPRGTQDSPVHKGSARALRLRQEKGGALPLLVADAKREERVDGGVLATEHDHVARHQRAIVAPQCCTPAPGARLARWSPSWPAMFRSAAVAPVGLPRPLPTSSGGCRS